MRAARAPGLLAEALLLAALLLAGCSRGRSACEEATRAASAAPDRYRQLSVQEEPGETPGMTYFRISYLVTGPDGVARREEVSCSYMPDLDVAVAEAPS